MADQNALVLALKKTSQISQSLPKNALFDKQMAAANLEEFENEDNTKQKATVPTRQHREAAKVANQEMHLHLFVTRFSEKHNSVVQIKRCLHFD